MGMDLIRQAVLKNCGGFKEASDAQIMAKWNSLDEQTQEKYLQSIKPAKDLPVPLGRKTGRKAKDAAGDKS